MLFTLFSCYQVQKRHHLEIRSHWYARVSHTSVHRLLPKFAYRVSRRASRVAPWSSLRIVRCGICRDFISLVQPMHSMPTMSMICILIYHTLFALHWALLAPPHSLADRDVSSCGCLPLAAVSISRRICPQPVGESFYFCWGSSFCRYGGSKNSIGT